MASGLRGIKTLKDFEFKDKVVFLRLDLNVPIKDGVILDETRLTASLPTIEYILDHGGKIIMCSHLGRPKGPGDKENSLEPVAARLSEVLKGEVILMEDPGSAAVKGLLPSLKRRHLILLENIRFESGETKDDEELASRLAAYSQIYINDAFGASHRAHASIHAMPRLMSQKGVGFLMEREIQFLDQLMENPGRPYWAIMGGAKVSDKIGVIEKLIDIVDGFIIGGAMAYTFQKALGHGVGKSLVEEDKIKYARELIERVAARGKSFLLPVDHLVADGIKMVGTATVTSGITIPETKMGVDIGPNSLAQFQVALKNAKTIFWNGPMGVFETPEFSKGTFGIAKAMAENQGIKVVGGGDSASAAHASGFADKMTHISTGGGASLEYLQGEKMPGLEALRQKR